MRFLFLLAFLGACERQSLGTSLTDNAAFRLDSLFTHGACTVYRFEDEGRAHYFACCATPGAGSVERSVNCGKACTRLEADVFAMAKP